MFQQIDSDVNISSQDIRILIALAEENIVMSVGNSLLDRYLDFLLTLYYSLTQAKLAFVLLAKALTSSWTSLASDLSLSIHARSKLD